MTISRRALLLVASFPFLAAGCSNDPPEDEPDSPSAVPTEVGNIPVKPDDSTAGDPNGPVPADAELADESAAQAAAVATMEIWVQGSTLEERQWREQLDATLTPTGQESTATIWGYRVRDTEVTANPEIVRANAASAVVRVTTNYTSYEVTVVKTSDGTWLTSNLTSDITEGAEQ